MQFLASAAVRLAVAEPPHTLTQARGTGLTRAYLFDLFVAFLPCLELVVCEVDYVFVELLEHNVEVFEGGFGLSAEDVEDVAVQVEGVSQFGELHLEFLVFALQGIQLGL